MPKPVAVGLLTGSVPAKRRAKRQVKPDDGKPSLVDWADPEAKLCWAHTTAMLEGMGLLSRTDEKLIVRYCQLWARWVRAERFLAEQKSDSYVLKDKEGKVRCLMPWPQVAIVNKLSIQLLRMEQDMGLTPAARARLANDYKPTRAALPEDEFFQPLRIAQ